MNARSIRILMTALVAALFSTVSMGAPAAATSETPVNYATLTRTGDAVDVAPAPGWTCTEPATTDGDLYESRCWPLEAPGGFGCRGTGIDLFALTSSSASGGSRCPGTGIESSCDVTASKPRCTDSAVSPVVWPTVYVSCVLYATATVTYPPLTVTASASATCTVIVEV